MEVECKNVNFILIGNRIFEIRWLHKIEIAYLICDISTLDNEKFVSNNLLGKFFLYALGLAINPQIPTPGEQNPVPGLLHIVILSVDPSL